MNELIQEEFNNFFTAIGFRKKGKLWYKEYEEFTLIFHLRKNTIWKDIYIDYGALIKYLELPYEFNMLNWHLFGGLGDFDRKYNRGLQNSLEFKLSEVFSFIKVTVFPILERACTPEVLRKFPYDEAYKIMTPSGKVVIDAINEFQNSIK